MITSSRCEFGHQLGEDRIDRGRGHHHPEGARRLQLRDERIERIGSRGAIVGQRLDVGRVRVEHDAAMSAPHQPADHVGAHAAKTNHSELHLGDSFFLT